MVAELWWNGSLANVEEGQSMAFVENDEHLRQRLLEKVAKGEKVSEVSELPLELCQLLADTIVTQWNCEWHGGLNYLTCINLAPGEAERQVVSHVGLEELGHARILEKGPLKALKIEPWKQFVRSVKQQPRLLHIFRYPERFTTWAHFVMFNHLQDRSAAIQLARFKEGPFAPWSEAIAEIEAEEEAHVEHGESGLRKLASSEEGRRNLQQALDDWLLLTLEVFGRPDYESSSLKLYRQYNLKDSNDKQREIFKKQIKPLLDECGLESPLLA
jgi:ring-1,2-phenylacetyl-CoA epoxidase subunit PaaA